MLFGLLIGTNFDDRNVPLHQIPLRLELAV